ncbi:hypothetical protein [Agrobacterium sp. SORGH_AS 787]|uniref:hypothetical protein n=1 Tax=Agrobacterium sp. SORGH_AS 787 TaxID=3041775 RepID=UPI0027804CAF|nr:hypothetical protein [Rhizobium sp. SORGH_AS_0787]
MIKNAALGASDQHGGALIRHLTAAILQAFETNTVKDSLQICDLLGRQLAADSLKCRVGQGSSSRNMLTNDVNFCEQLISTPDRIRCRIRF